MSRLGGPGRTGRLYRPVAHPGAARIKSAVSTTSAGSRGQDLQGAAPAVPTVTRPGIGASPGTPPSVPAAVGRAGGAFVPDDPAGGPAPRRGRADDRPVGPGAEAVRAAG